MVRFVLSSIFAAVLLKSASACPTPSWIGDGYCDPSCNNENNEWDGGDCCERTCVDDDYDCGINGYDCKQPKAETKYKIVKQYSGFEVTLQCDKEAGAGYAVGYSYSLSEDLADLGSKRTYRNDFSVPDECQQQFRGQRMPSYRTDQCSGGRRQSDPFCYDRGHIIMAAHMNGSQDTKQDASYVTNLLPQASGFNQAGGSWKATEDIIECHRDYPDVQKLDIFGGMLYNDEENDLFLESHGIPTPDLYYKVVVKHFKDKKRDPDVIAWLMKNKFDEKAHKLDKKYKDGGNLIQVKELKRIADDPLDGLPETFTERAYSAGSSWDFSTNESRCKRGSSDAEFSRVEF